jgi:polysaccharide pyruvyl transferase CsaB
VVPAATSRKIFISGYYGFDNAGDEAILSVMLRELRDEIGPIEVAVLSGNPAATAVSHGVIAVLWSDPLAIAEAVRAADLVLIGGGGLFHDYNGFVPDGLLTAGNWGLGFQVTAALLAALYDKPLMLYAVGVGPLFSGEGRKFTLAACEAAQAITVRDEGSKQILESIGVPTTKVVVTADPAFLLERASSERVAQILEAEGLSPGESLVGVALRPWTFDAQPVFWEQQVAAGLDKFLERFSGKVIFLPFQRIPGELENDIAVAERVQSQMRRQDQTVLFRTRYDPAELAGILGACQLVVGMRLHAVIFSVLGRVPCVALRYDPKVEEIASQAGLREWMIDLGVLTAELLASRMHDALVTKWQRTPALDDLISRAQSTARIVREVLAAPHIGEVSRLSGEVLELLRASVLAQLHANQAAEKRAAILDAQLRQANGAAERKRNEAIAFLQAEVANRDRIIAERAEAIAFLQAQTVHFQNRLRAAAEKQKSMLQGLRAFHARWEHQLSEYRTQRAWKVMLYFRKAYDLMLRRGWRGCLRLLSSGTAGLAEYELHFPDLWSYVPEFQDPVLPPEQESSIDEKATPKPIQQKYDVIVLGIIDFDFRFQRPQQIAAQYARSGHRVFWVSPTRFLPPSSEKAFEAVQLRDNLWEIHLRGEQPDVYMGSLEPALVRTLTASLAELYRVWAVGDSIALAQLPFWRQVTLGLREAEGSIVVYDCMDDWDTFENMGKFNVSEERKFVHECDVLAVTGQVLVEKFTAQGLSPVLARNGADYDFFAQAQSRHLLDSIPRPVVGYFGAIADWIDLDLVYAVAKIRPQYSFVLIGQVFGRDTSVLESLPNVFLLGNQSYERIPAFLAEFDACIIPFLLNQVTKATDPVKLYEYFSQGKPVVATDMAELAQCAGLLYIGRGAEDFAGKLDLALNETGDDLRRQRVEFAKQNNWAQRVDTIDSAVRNAFPLVSILIVTYNSAEYVRPCLDSLRDTYPSYEVIVVDNHSEDSTVEILKEYAAADPRIHLHCLSSNTGFAAGNNLAARESAGEYLILLNVDVMVTPGWIERLLRHLRKDTSVGLICPVTNFVANEAKINVDYTTFDEMRLFAMNLAAKNKGKSVDLEVVALFCAAISRDLWQRIGELDEAFGMGMFEDDDFSMRVLKSGHRLVAAEDCFVHHFGQGSFSKLPSKKYDQLFETNRRRYEEKWKVTWKPHKTRVNVRPAFEEKRFVPAEFYRLSSSAQGIELTN